MTPALLDDLVRAAASGALAARGLDPSAVPADAGVGRPRDPAQGEYASTLALRAAGPVGVAPRELAGWLADALAERPEVEGADVAGPGFLNLRMTAAGRAALVAEALHGDGEAGDGEAGDDVRTAAGAVVVPDELVAAVGADAARYAVLRSLATTDVARRVPENPLFRVQYAHARLASIARNAAELGVAVGPDPGVLTHPDAVELIRWIAGFPAAARSGAPYRVARHLEALAGAALDVTCSCPALPKGDEEVTDLHRARLAMMAAARRVLANGLGLLLVSAPERI